MYQVRPWLPSRFQKNSRVIAGKTWPAPDHVTRMKRFRIYRWDPVKWTPDLGPGL